MSSAPISVPGPVPDSRLADADVLDAFVSRWSRRALSPRAVPPEMVRAIFEAARWAPSA
jgi:nitroreductase